MKNLKRALSLVLSAAMMVGMMAIGTSAAKFSDVDSSDNLEAIELMAMIGVMEGTGDDTFEPDRLVTRNEMAVVICNLMDLKLNGFHNFTDVPEWADKYVGALYINGLTSGTSATTYGGSAQVTTTEAALMIMKTLGYFEYQVEFEDDWQLATIKRATLLNLFEDIDAGVKDALTRGEVAQMVMNALTQQLVVARDNSSNISVEGNGTNVNITNSNYSYDKVWDKVNTDPKLLMEKLYDGKLTAEGADADDFKRPATKWTYTGNGKVETVVAPDAPAIVLTAKTSEDDMTKLLKDYNKNSLIDVYVNGENKATDILKGALYPYTNVKDGRTIEIYVADDGATITDMVVIDQWTDKVYSVTKADEKTGADRYVTVNGMNFDTEDFAKKDWVVYTKAWNGTKFVIKSMEAAEFVEGKITGITYDGSAIKSVKIDGVSYKVNFTYAPDLDLGDTVNLVLDTYGNLLGENKVIAAVPDVSEYVVVKKVGSNDFGDKTIQVLKSDGTSEVVGFEFLDEDGTIDDSLANVYAWEWDKTNNVVLHDGVYTMEDSDNDGKYEFYNVSTAADPLNDNKAAGFDKGIQGVTLNDEKNNLNNGYEIADDAVVFALKLKNDATKGKVVDEWTVTTGAKLAAADGATVNYGWANKDDDGFYSLKLAYVTSDMSSSSDVLYGYVTADAETVKNADNKTVQSITFWNGEETMTLLTHKDNSTALAKGDFFSYTLKDNEITVKAKNVASSAIISYNGTKIDFANNIDTNSDGVVDAMNDIDNATTGLAYFEMADDAVVIYVNAEDKAGVEDGEITLADKNDAETLWILNAKYILDKDGKKVAALFVDVLNDIDDVI